MNIREKFIQDHKKKIEAKYSHLNDKERNDLMYFKNKKQLSTADYNKLKDRFAAWRSF